MMDRRRFLLTWLAGVMALPLIAGAQPSGKVWRIGFLGFAPGGFEEPFREQLRELGYLEGKNLVVEFRWASPDARRYPTLAGDLLDAGVELIVARGNEAVISAKGATTKVPIVGFMMLEPVELGLVKSLARPGGNVTGTMWEEGTDQGAKKIELFKQLVPNVSPIAVVWNPTTPGLARYWPPARAAATTLGIKLNSVEISRPEDLDRIWDIISADRPNSIFFTGDWLTNPRRATLCNAATKRGFPTLAPDRAWSEAGCLMSYAADLRDHHRRAAIYVDKILKGARTSDLPIERPTRFDLVINAKTAKALGLTIPPSLLARADQVIE